jgi:hypothetical protein
MYLASSSGSSLRLTIVGYEFPQKQPEDKHDYDANWLVVKLDFVRDDNAWTAIDPCLTTWDVDELAVWFDRLRLRQPLVRPALSFAEPLLTLESVDAGSPSELLRVFIEGELRPSWQTEQGMYQEDLWIDFPLAEIDLQAATQSLRDQLAQFPVRNAPSYPSLKSPRLFGSHIIARIAARLPPARRGG